MKKGYFYIFFIFLTGCYFSKQIYMPPISSEFKKGLRPSHKEKKLSYQYYNRANILFSKKDLTGSEKYIRKSIIIDKYNPDFWKILGDIYYTKERFVKSFEYFEKSFKYGNRSLDFTYKIIDNLLILERYKNALKYAEYLGFIKKDLYYENIAKGDIYQKKYDNELNNDNLKNALKYYYRAKKSKKYIDYILSLANTFYKYKKYSKAKNYYSYFLEKINNNLNNKKRKEYLIKEININSIIKFTKLRLKKIHYQIIYKKAIKQISNNNFKSLPQYISMLENYFKETEEISYLKGIYANYTKDYDFGLKNFIQGVKINPKYVKKQSNKFRIIILNHYHNIFPC